MIQRLSAGQYAAIITELATPLAASLQMEIWGVEVSLSGRPLMRVFVENILKPDPAEEDAPFAEGGVDVEACAHLSRLLGLALDVEADSLPESYILEVSSPGLERPFFSLAQMPPYIGQEIYCTLLESPPPFEDRRKFSGILHAVEGNTLTLALKEAIPGQESVYLPIAWENIRKAHLVHHFPDTSKPVSPSRGKKKATHSTPV